MGIKPNQHTQKIIRNMGNVIADVMENKAEGELLPHRQALSINGNDIEKISPQRTSRLKIKE